LSRIQDNEVQVPCIRPDDNVFHPDAHLSSIIRLDDENFLSGLQSVSRSFELLSVVSVRTSQQLVRTPFSVRQVKGFPFQMHVWEDSCNHPDDMVFCPNATSDKASCVEDVQPSGRQSPLSGCIDLFMEIACSRSATVLTLGQHRPEVALFWKKNSANLKSRLHSYPSKTPPRGNRLKPDLGLL
jgi:hypothetical protein